MRRGFEMTGFFQNVVASEIDPYACKTYKHLYHQDAFHDLKSESFRKSLEDIPFDVLLAGFPCQTFSRAGKEEGFLNNLKGTIFWYITNIISRNRPRAIFLENVDNIVRHNKGETFQKIIKALEIYLDYKVIGVSRNLVGELEYSANNFIRNSKNFGIPQNRPRVYIMAFDRRRYGNEVEYLENCLPFESEYRIYDDLNDVLEFKADPQWYMSSGYLETLEKHKKRQKSVGNGFGYRVVNAPGIQHPIAHTLLATGGSGKERNLVYDPQEGIAGRFYPRKKTPLNSKGIRVMTPREWGKLQGFINYAFVQDGVDYFSFPNGITKTQQYKLFGNSVTIPVVETMAEFMLNCFRVLGDVPNG